MRAAATRARLENEWSSTHFCVAVGAFDAAHAYVVIAIRKKITQLTIVFRRIVAYIQRMVGAHPPGSASSPPADGSRALIAPE